MQPTRAPAESAPPAHRTPGDPLGVTNHRRHRALRAPRWRWVNSSPRPGQGSRGPRCRPGPRLRGQKGSIWTSRTENRLSFPTDGRRGVSQRQSLGSPDTPTLAAGRKRPVRSRSPDTSPDTPGPLRGVEAEPPLAAPETAPRDSRKIPSPSHAQTRESRNSGLRGLHGTELPTSSVPTRKDLNSPESIGVQGQKRRGRCS